MKYKLCLLFIFTSINIFAQVSKGINYQALAFDNSGNILKNKKISLHITIKSGVDGKLLYREKNSTSTDRTGLFTIQLGGGVPDTTLSFSSVQEDASTPWLNVEMFSDEGKNYKLISSSKMHSIHNGHNVGEFFQGGIIFETDANGEHGVIVSANDLSKDATWGLFAFPDSVIGAKDKAVGTGKMNTFKILKALNTPGIAARLCVDYKVDKISGWYLPSKDELNLIYENLKAKSIANFSDAMYWTSSETDFNNAWLIDFKSGRAIEQNQDTPSHVRAIKEF